jgi:cytochrome c oxidase cbb3-type subunit III
MGLKIVALIAVFVGLSVAQQPTPTPNGTPPPAGRKNAPPGRRNIRDFLGLGREPDAEAAARGAKLYGPTCGFCHGPAARGAEGPNLVRSSVVLHDDKGELIGPVIQNGRPDRGMPAFSSFTEAQLKDIAEFLHMQVELAVNRGKYKVQNIVTGNPKAGENYFNGEGKCNTCHSVTGDLARIGSKYEPPDLQATFLYPAAGSAPSGNPKITVTLPSGKTMTGTAKHLDDFYVSFYDAAGDYHSINLEKGMKVEVEDKLVFHRHMLDKYTDTQMHDLTAYLVTLK